MSQPIASLSLDLDNKWSYLKTHGDRAGRDFPATSMRVVPRFLELLDELGLRITVFVVGQDAAIEQNQARRWHPSPPPATKSATTRSITSRGCICTRPRKSRRRSAAAEEAIARRRARANRFRGPGYSLSPAVLIV